MFPIKIDFCCVALHEKRLKMWNYNKHSFDPLGLTVYEFLSGSGTYKLHYNLIDKKPNNLYLSEQKFYGNKRYWYPLQSHKAILKAAIERNAENLLMIEDDAILSEDYKDKIEDCSNFIKNYDWDIFFLGCILNKNNYSDVSETKFVKKIYNCRGLQGVIIKNRLFRFLYEMPNIMCLDEFIGECLCKKSEVYGIFPSLISQDNSISLVSGNLVLQKYFKNLRED